MVPSVDLRVPVFDLDVPKNVSSAKKLALFNYLLYICDIIF